MANSGSYSDPNNDLDGSASKQRTELWDEIDVSVVVAFIIIVCVIKDVFGAIITDQYCFQLSSSKPQYLFYRKVIWWSGGKLTSLSGNPFFLVLGMVCSLVHNNDYKIVIQSLLFLSCLIR